MGGRLMEVSNNRVTFLADTLEPAADIDLKQAMDAREWAERRLKQEMPPTDKEAAATLAPGVNRLR